ncbi:MAG: DUF3307 domain-containing protein [Akkermansiaceae bacterium]
MSTIYDALFIFFAMAAGHALADFPLQGRFLSFAKNRHADLSSFFPNETPPRHVWVHALSCHALIHAAFVGLITGSVIFAAAELILHWLIDYAKCEGWTGFHTDQLLHYLCKAAYATLLLQGIGL